MSCHTLRDDILLALRLEAEGAIQKARMNVEVYLHNPAGIGEHPDVLAAIQDQLDTIAKQTERLETLKTYFSTHEHPLS